MIETISIIALAVVIIAQAVERYFYSRMMSDKLENAMKAVMSRNIQEFLLATKKDDPKQTEEIDLDQPLEEASDEDFLHAITNPS